MRILPLFLALMLFSPAHAIDNVEIGLEPKYPKLNPDRTTLATEAQIKTALKTLPGWKVKDGCLYKVFVLPNFIEAVAFITKISHPIQQADHHPEIRNIYGKVYLGFTTHDQGNKLTTLDLKVAQAVETLARSSRPR